tara:strand:+ start:701 stop:1048 length:348 start_codon:yes stop_codon:yes gene_type:complete
MDIEEKKEIADQMKKRFLIQVEYEFDEDSQGFKRQVNFLQDSDTIATIEIINLIRSNKSRLRNSIGQEVDDIIINLMTNILRKNELDEMMERMTEQSQSMFTADGRMNLRIREDM